METLTASVLIPAFNESASLPHLLKALAAQTVKPLEIIVIDNASTDDTGAVAKQHGATVIREDRKGTNNALETGRLAAKGTLIARIDADCVPDPDWIARASERFAVPSINAVTGPYDYHDGSPFFRAASLIYQKYLWSTIHFYLGISHTGAIIVGGNSMMRAASLNEIRGFDRSIKFYGDDTDLAKKLSRIGTVVFDKTLLMKSSARRFHNEGVATILWKYFKCFVKMTVRNTYIFNARDLR
jgi:glycosyltransferase involved in cell wall biosynthesis